MRNVRHAGAAAGRKSGAMKEKSLMNHVLSHKVMIYKACMLIFDIIAVNFSYWFAMILRFYIGFQFRAGAEVFMKILERFSPVYTVVCILIFAAFRMYNTLWKEAGIRDLNNVILANAAATVFFVVGSLATKNRMPLTIYFIGPVIQLTVIGMSRLGIKIALMEWDHIGKKNKSSINVMIVGMEYIARIARRQIDHSETMMTRCVVDTRSTMKGLNYNGVPVIAGTDDLTGAIERFGINYVLVADAFLSESRRGEIRRICEDKGIEFADLTGYIENGVEALPLTSLLRTIDGPVKLMVNGEERAFSSGENAILSVTRRYLVKRIAAEPQSVVIELTDNPLVPNDTSDAWVNEYKEKTGADVSFF